LGLFWSVTQKLGLSVLSQKNVDFEYLIIDGASTDETLDIIKKYTEDNPIRLISETDTGIYVAINKGIKMALGEWVHLIHAGDLYTSEEILKIISELPLDLYDVITTPIYIRKKDYLKPWYPKYLNNERHYYFPHPGLFISTNFYLTNKLYRENFKIISDGLFYSDNFHKAKILIKTDIEPTVIMDMGISHNITARYIYENFFGILISNYSFKYKFNNLIKLLIKTMNEIKRKGYFYFGKKL
jgi:glycosyltransferase involved in cell wall biosynthesis